MQIISCSSSYYSFGYNSSKLNNHNSFCCCSFFCKIKAVLFCFYFSLVNFKPSISPLVPGIVVLVFVVVVGSFCHNRILRFGRRTACNICLIYIFSAWKILQQNKLFVPAKFLTLCPSDDHNYIFLFRWNK
jgi:hypothetical protein